MKILLFLFLSFCIICFTSTAQKTVLERAISTVKAEFLTVNDQFLESIIESSVKHKTITKNRDTLVVITIDSIKAENGIFLTEKDIQPVNFIILLNGINSKVIFDGDTQKSEHFKMIGEVCNLKHSYLLFYYISPSLGHIQYLVFDLTNSLFYQTEFIDKNIRVDYLSFDLQEHKFVYYSESTENKQYGALSLCAKKR